MKDNEILTHAKRMGWASVYIDNTKLGPGLTNWQTALHTLTPEQRATLIKKIARFEVRTKGTIVA